jgi:putative Mg2+ transporter-C (MgtC) family protein
MGEGATTSTLGGMELNERMCSSLQRSVLMSQATDVGILTMLLRLALAGVIGGLIGYERRLHHKAIGIAGMMLVAVGSASYMLLAAHLAQTDPAAISRALQGLLQGIGFLGGAVIFKSGTDVRGIKTAAAIWITGAVGLAIGTWFWGLGLIVGGATVIILFVADQIPSSVTGAVPPEDQDSPATPQADIRHK